MGTLYELTGSLLALQEMMESGEEDEQVLADTFEAVGGEFDIKMEGYGCVIRNLEATVSALKDEEERLSARRKAAESRIKWLKDRILNVMVTLNRKAVRGERFSFFVKNTAPRTVIDIQEKVPFGFMKVTQTNDLVKIKDFLASEEGKNCSWAHLETGQSLTMR